jgi:hypothetical protein
MNFLSRKASLPNDTERVVQREIEITVERTWTEIRTTGIQAPLPEKNPSASVGSLSGQSLPCVSTPHSAMAEIHLQAPEDTHVKPNR